MGPPRFVAIQPLTQLRGPQKTTQSEISRGLSRGARKGKTSEAAKEVYDFLGCKDNLKWYFRRGYHSHTQEDSTLLVNLIMNLKEGEELLPYYYKTPFKPYEKIWDWKQPEK